MARRQETPEERETRLAARRAEWAARSSEFSAKRRAAHKANPQKACLANKAWRDRNPEKVRAANQKKYREHKDWWTSHRANWPSSQPTYKSASAKRRRPHDRERYANEPELRKRKMAASLRWKRKNSARVLEYTRQYQVDHPEVVIAGYYKRRARKLLAEVGTDRQAYRRFVKLVRTAEKLPCHWCGKITRRGKRHLDHIIPLSRKGPDCVYNLCCACPNCNQRKNDKLPEEFSGQFELPFSSSASASHPPTPCRVP